MTESAGAPWRRLVRRRVVAEKLGDRLIELFGYPVAQEK